MNIGELDINTKKEIIMQRIITLQKNYYNTTTEINILKKQLENDVENVALNNQIIGFELKISKMQISFDYLNLELTTLENTSNTI